MLPLGSLEAWPLVWKIAIYFKTESESNICKRNGEITIQKFVHTFDLVSKASGTNAEALTLAS